MEFLTLNKAFIIAESSYLHMHLKNNISFFVCTGFSFAAHLLPPVAVSRGTSLCGM